ncbi:MAG: hypothetical protein ABIX01_21150 [Chitinophagaceae bacterium]
MLYKKIINLLLIAILSATILPLKQVGNLIFKRQLTEEISEIQDDYEKKGDGKFDLKKYTCCFNDALDIHSQLIASYYYGEFNSPLPISPVADIHTPPPNSI